MITIDTDDNHGASPDAQRFFKRQWAVYSKIITNDYLHHQQTTAALQRALLARPPGPLRFVDLACGDACTSARALSGLQLSHFHGVDLSLTALQQAAANLQALDCPVTLAQDDFGDALQRLTDKADVIWIGLSLHHFDTDAKLALLRHAVASLADGTGRMQNLQQQKLKNLLQF